MREFSEILSWLDNPITYAIIGWIVAKIYDAFVFRRSRIERLVDKSEDSHVKIAELADTLIHMSGDVEIDDRYPKIVKDYDSFERWFNGYFNDIYAKNHFWLTNASMKNVAFAQNYFIKFGALLNHEVNINSLRRVARNDFITISNMLRKGVYDYYAKDYIWVSTKSILGTYRLDSTQFEEWLRTTNLGEYLRDSSGEFAEKATSRE